MTNSSCSLSITKNSYMSKDVTPTKQWNSNIHLKIRKKDDCAPSKRRQKIQMFPAEPYSLDRK